MIERPGTWSEVGVGTTLLTKTELPLLVVRTADTKKGRWYLAHDHHRREIRITPKPSDGAVTILECTPEEAELIAVHGLRAEHIVQNEREARMPERAKRWVVPPFPVKSRGALNRAKDHIAWYHGTYTTDINTLKQATEAHAEMHAENFMDRPHTHKED